MYKDFIKKNYDDILTILNCLKIGVYITDGNGNTLMLNDESCKTGGLTRGEVLGKNMKSLEEMGFVENSISLKALKSGKEESIIQNLGDGDKVYATGVPLYISDNKIDLIVTTERNITETLALKDLIEEKEKDSNKIKEEIEYLKKQNITMWGSMIAEDEETKQLAEKALRIAKVDSTILLLGESGTGKEVLANFIYENSSRVGMPFIKVNCAAIPENLIESELFGYEPGAFTGADINGKIGLFEMANKGTLFLDEIGELPLHLQSKLLRVLQEREIFRIGGKNHPVGYKTDCCYQSESEGSSRKGAFRGDLYYRLNIMPLECAPLKGRKKDIKALTLSFIQQFNKRYKINKSITDDAINVLQEFDWPGNIRELENIVERIMISFNGEVINKFQVERAIGTNQKLYPDDLSSFEEKSIDDLLEEYECYILKSMMKEHKKACEVARVLKMNKSTLSRRLKKYGIEK